MVKNERKTVFQVSHKKYINTHKMKTTIGQECFFLCYRFALKLWHVFLILGWEVSRRKGERGEKEKLRMFLIPKNDNNSPFRTLLPGNLERRLKFKFCLCPRTRSSIFYIPGEYSKHSLTPGPLTIALPIRPAEGWGMTVVLGTM